jgi:fucose permease
MRRLEKSTMLVVVIYLAFISLGLPDGVLGVAWPAIRADMGLPLESVGILTTMLLCLSALSSILSGTIVAKWGAGGVTFISALLTGGALLGFSFSPSFLCLILLTIPLGLGQGAVDAGLNLYVAQHYSSRHMSWLHCFWGMGATMGPLIMTRALAQGNAWRPGYRTVSIIQLSLAAIVVFSLAKGLWKEQKSSEDNRKNSEEDQLTQRQPARKGARFLAVFLFFLYSGLEFSMCVWVNSVMIESRHMSIYLAGITASSCYAAIMTGRFLSGFVVNRLGNMRMIRYGLLLAFAGVICVGVLKSDVGEIAGVVLFGLGMAPVYPCLMHETPVRFEKSVSDHLIGYQGGAACIGGSIVTSGTGIILSHVGLELLFPILAAFLVMAFFVNEMLNNRTKSIPVEVEKESA